MKLQCRIGWHEWKKEAKAQEERIRDEYNREQRAIWLQRRQCKDCGKVEMRIERI